MGNIPPEVDRLLNGCGSILLVKGEAGAGKTLFVLDLIKEYGGLYVSTTVHPEHLYRTCAGLEEAIPKDFFLDATAFRPVPMRRAHFDLEVDDSILKEILDNAPPSLQQSNLPPLLQEIVKKVEVAKVPFCVVVDSWDAIFALGNFRSGRPEDPQWNFDEIQRTLINLFRRMPLNLVMVTEGAKSTKLDFLADAIVTLNWEAMGGRFVRTFQISKLRGFDIKVSEYVFSLMGGNFRYHDPSPFVYDGELSEWTPRQDKEGLFSTGSESIDVLLGGGLPRGSTVMLEIGTNVPQIVYETFIKSMTANFLSHGRNVMIVPFGGMDIHRFEREMYVYVGKEIFDTFAKVVVSTDVEGLQKKPYIVPMRYDDLDQDWREYQQAYNRLREASGSATLEVIGMDTQEARYGEEAYKKMLPTSSEQTKREGNLAIRISRPGLESVNQRAINVADVHLRMVEKDGVTLLCGIKPYTGMFVAKPVVEDGVIRLQTFPIT